MRLVVYLWVSFVKVVQGSEIVSTGILDIVSRAPFWQLVVRCLSCLRSAARVLSGDDYAKMLRFVLYSGYTLTRQFTELFLNFTHFLRAKGLGTTTSVENGGDFTETTPAPSDPAYRYTLWILTLLQVSS